MPDVAGCIVNESREVCVIFFHPRNIAIRASGQPLSGRLMLSVKPSVEYFDNVYALVRARGGPDDHTLDWFSNAMALHCTNTCDQVKVLAWMLFARSVSPPQSSWSRHFSYAL